MPHDDNPYASPREYDSPPVEELAPDNPAPERRRSPLSFLLPICVVIGSSVGGTLAKAMLGANVAGAASVGRVLGGLLGAGFVLLILNGIRARAEERELDDLDS